MFERFFQKAMRSAARLLFAAAILMLIWGVGVPIHELSQVRGDKVTGFGGDRWGSVDTLLIIFSTAFDPAAQLFFGAVIVYYLEIWMDRQRT